MMDGVVMIAACEFVHQAHLGQVFLMQQMDYIIITVFALMLGIAIKRPAFARATVASRVQLVTS